MRITIISLMLTVFCFSGWGQENVDEQGVTLRTPDEVEFYPPQTEEESEGKFPIGWWLLAASIIVIQLWYAGDKEAQAKFPFDWPELFRGLGSLSFAAFVVFITMVATSDKEAGWEIFYILLTPFVSYVSCYLTAHVLETFDEIKKNTDKLRESD